MNKNFNKTPPSKNKNTSNVSKKNNHSRNNSFSKTNKKKNKETGFSKKRNKNQIKLTKKKSPNGTITQIVKWKKVSQPVNKDILANNDKTIKKDWKNISQKKLVDNLFNKFTKNKQIDEKKEGNEEKEKNVKDSLKILEEKQKKWFDDLKNSMKKSMKDFNDAQKKALDDLDKWILDKMSSKDKEDEFLKEMLLILIAQNAFSKDLQNLGQVNVSTIERESYL